MLKLFLGRKFESFMDVVHYMYNEDERINVTNCKPINDTEYELEYRYSLTKNEDEIHHFKVGIKELHEKITKFEFQSYHFSRSEVAKAINKAWDEQINLLIYPKNMNMIIVDIPREEDCYLKRTTIIESNYFDSREDFERQIKELLAS